MRLGYKLIAEAYGPQEIVRQGVLAEQAGFDFVEVSDHYHPWLTSTPHSGFAWSMLAALAARTERIELATGVTCPTFRYHPAIIAQAAATTALLSDGRFSLGLGSGERLNEHVVGDAWPSVSTRQARLVEAIEIIRALWSGGYHSYDGRYFQLDDARVFDLPDELPKMLIAAGGDRAAKLAAERGDGLFATEPLPELIEGYRAAGGTGPRYGEVPLAWAPDVESAARSAHEKFRFGLTGWKVQAELPNPINFDAATAMITPEDMVQNFGCGPDVERHLEVIGQFVDAGFDNLVLINAGTDPDGFFEFFTDTLAPRLRQR
ncbi:TIGR03557 family F420-dependent LLM class oxidoreductase [Naumannella halotolerans]|uniref:G6PDH family F420-dependent oxidoreductase n=1 Tax=Naumannella halotolerans TaxID=993414 RepID=A0A4R7J0Y0_9ACTN|nr:TIGR03557 family F420-dependent LLM class oxidoreductase [Naumannella halotolerans]TDT30046.1 G6PDH family F420-dependent oxidoreductase [Naumannella halotolerans]